MADPFVPPAIVCVVEGQGDARALPRLIERIAAELEDAPYIGAKVVQRIGRAALVNPGGIEAAVETAARDSGTQDAIFVLIDADDDCPAQLGRQLQGRAQAARPDRLISVVLARCEYENWFLAAAASLQGKRDLSPHLQPPEDPESIRGAKEWLRRHMPPQRAYSETADQPALACLFNLEQARQRSDSFDKCYREIARLVTALTQPPPPGADPPLSAPPP